MYPNPPAKQWRRVAARHQRRRGHTAHEGTPNPDHILINAGRRSGEVRVVFDGMKLGSFGPVARIFVRAGDGDDVVVAKPQMKLPVHLDGGAGDDCL
jgi:hypothetical protein